MAGRVGLGPASVNRLAQPCRWRRKFLDGRNSIPPSWVMPCERSGSDDFGFGRTLRHASSVTPPRPRRELSSSRSLDRISIIRSVCHTVSGACGDFCGYPLDTSQAQLLGNRGWWIAQFEKGDLALAGEVAGFTEDACGFLRSMEAHGIFGVDKIDPPW